ncbi:A/G-specific adenine glycosylase [Sporosarcina sp. HYO08]|uniref:A/G-specific adenine glycosylase n=1 Tax=Sporosarcina sp. HYO08 TaxID=1759557 RepID=UPI0007954421|nr:A/G-specific adenine glycosylase [Sporosarcina sp. HYO08]KXH78834.1 A/G-specific adenine glycosylase [Sporosarcina sp. HYO08]
MQIIEKKVEFREALLSWYNREKRDLPWRRTNNPYYIWVSEVMLQQTRVDTVIPYYERFIKAFPTMEALAEADEHDLLKLWEGLGYYSRARNLQTGVKEVIESYGGKIPANRKDISTLKGVGPYTAGAVLSIAFGIPEHAVDGNVMRVISRLLLIEEDIAIPRNKKIFEQVVMDLIDPEDPSSFNQGLMELGATICTPNPKCLLCPVMDFCSAFHEGRQDELPIKTKKTANKTIPIAAYALQNEEGKWLLRKRPSKGLLANLWEFPTVELTSGSSPKKQIEKEMEIVPKNMEELLSFKHIFTHLTWDLKSFTARINDPIKLLSNYQLFTAEEVNALPMPVPMLKIWEEIKKQRCMDE